MEKQLKKAEKSSLEIEEGDTHKEILINLFEEFEKENKFKDASSELLKALFEVPDLHITLKATLEKDIVAFIIIYLYGNSDTYYVVWSKEVGRRYYANNLLLFQAIILLKERKYSYFDLGGYDERLTPDITHFKREINGKEYQMLGEFIAL